MSEPTGKTNPAMKTLGVKLPDGLHAQSALVTQIDELGLNDAVLTAVQEYIDRNRSETDFADRATSVVA